MSVVPEWPVSGEKGRGCDLHLERRFQDERLRIQHWGHGTNPPTAVNHECRSIPAAKTRQASNGLE